MAITPEIKQKYDSWLNSPYIDDADKVELRDIAEQPDEIVERFYQDMAFGTGGLRGIRGMGTNRLNKYVVRKATQGLANYMLKSDPEAQSKGVVIAHDSRIMSPEFSVEAAMVLAGNGIKAYLFDSLRPTPELSFAVRELGALSGIVVTASHNPPAYNGYKVYWEDGAQIVPPHDTGIISEVNAIEDFAEVKVMDEAEAKAAGLIVVLGADMDDKYTAAVKEQVVSADAIAQVAEEFPIVYTPLHGTGNLPVQAALKAAGFTQVFVVPEQEAPDGNFPTVAYPNPEEPAVFELGIKLAEEKGSTIVMANDPDADRIGVAVRAEDGTWHYPNGNQIGLLLTEYILDREEVPANAAVISTVVSTPMLDKVTEAHNVKQFRTLTGFKYIGEKIRQFEEGTYDATYVFGFEESYGYLKGTHSRDKDAVVSTMLIADMAAYFHAQGSDILKELDKLYAKYGYYQETLKSFSLSGKAGAEKIKAIMASFRDDSPSEINGSKVIIRRDFLKGEETDLVAGTTTKLDLPSSNVLQFVTENGAHITMRPSGTEPKIKFYFGVKADTQAAVSQLLNETVDAFMASLEQVMA
ncbi:phospho-sugar mutase [Pontibacter sp. G13]|uniref:phospho-sugar mutase n=1 Tax=Pontibacter sp. G13 TaxID=3074898 RepID=UPI002889EACF|nr:phospho-sugar mutase [Pontibacter sp. G13]WNJ17386.1 phospho-sugar mutase [Pontibacter sp. G13]